MTLRNKLGALLGAGLLTFVVAGVALADGNVAWDGQQGLTDGALTTSDCDTDSSSHIVWVLSLGGGGNTVTSGTLTLSGTGSGTYTGTITGNEMKFTTPFFTLDGLIASADFVGDLGSGASNLVISHGCVGPAPTPTPSPTPTLPGGGGGGGGGGGPTQPPTDTLGSTNSSGPSDGAWLLVVALGVLLASVVVLTPARAKNRR
jgi:hypothetical protein